jgi:hypothetical protein
VADESAHRIGAILLGPALGELSRALVLYAVLSLTVVRMGLAQAMVAVWQDPETKALPVVAGVLLLTGDDLPLAV